MKITLRAARVNKGMTQTEAANLLHVTVGTVVRWEKGITAPPYTALEMMSKIYDWPVDLFILPTEFK